MNNPHNTLEELALYATQGFLVKELASIRKHLQICSACRTDPARVSVHLALMGLVVQERGLPLGARQRFIKRVAASASVKPQVTEPGGRKNSDDHPGNARIFEISGKCIACNLHSSHIKPVCKIVSGTNSAIEKNSSLMMKAAASMTTRNKLNNRSKIETATPAPSRVWAARIVNIF